MMKSNSTNRVIAAMMAIAVLAAAFWMLLLSPKRDELGKLEVRITAEESSLVQNRAEVASGLEAQKAYPTEYQQLVVLGEATPADSETASLLVQLNRIANRSHIKFTTFQLGAGGGEGSPPAEPVPAEGGAYPSATEVAASTLPLGATVGSAGLAVMPYSLKFQGNFFQIAKFIRGLDSLVKTKDAAVDVTGRLITIDGFSLTGDQTVGFPMLQGTFMVTTYLVPPGQGITGGATLESPEGIGTQVAATTGVTP
jgi:Tfp pilus assembly protein PilO